MELVTAYSKQGVPYIVEATQPYLISSISDGHRNDVPAERALRITRLIIKHGAGCTDRYSGIG
jgi:hypothetical protein